MSLIWIKCGCGTLFTRDDKYKKIDNVLMRWKLKYCDKCLDAKVSNVFKNTLPKVIDAIANEGE